ncbi:MAG TPA: citrate transporter [Piscinibacter sp.]|uniref:citrate transporter n=1 Tax=Piscinibacter sp. TaxID=1903157 RepID=UPI001B5A95D0|nr:citrate transporter [Piscinibacter sp.]MBK7532950.1 citrate transporter [Piscinibacter sp.]MBL0094268.1 citrate transporter [Piscinibacter sp.]MBP6541824.1 citrate transporter [Piscinibacter sp.]HOY34696.1 citrate transporter [Piscinibacter sp.]HPG78607.1 citrate transporter [Piscinibacter sp.]
MSLLGIPFDFVLFALTLLGVATLHHHALKVALGGALAITLYQLLVTGFKAGAGMGGLAAHAGHEWVTLANLLGLLLGFALLADHFEKSRLPEILPHLLPDDWKGGFVLLIGVFVMSGFLDNIAAAMIGGTMASVLFARRVHIGYLAAIVAASNAGGAGSVVGDTTTTMMWIAGASPLWVVEAYIGGFAALMFFGVIAAKQQHDYQPIQKDDAPGVHVEYGRLGVVVAILLAAVAANLWFNLNNPAVLDHLPVIGMAVVLAILVTAPVRTPTWSLLPGAFKGSIFLLALVWCASLMPVDQLPVASWQTAFGLGFVSSVFDNIPLTALAIRQDGYDWGFLAYAVGFGGSMIWFGSSAGVALSNMYPEARSVGHWLRGGWHVAVGYVLGFMVMLVLLGWHGHPIKERAAAQPAATQGVSK